MAIHATASMVKSLQTTIPESPFQLGASQIKSIRELANIFMKILKFQTGMHCPLL